MKPPVPVGRLYWGSPLTPPGLLAVPVGRLYRVVAVGLTAGGLTTVVVVGFAGVEVLDDIIDYDVYRRK